MCHHCSRDIVLDTRVHPEYADSLMPLCKSNNRLAPSSSHDTVLRQKDIATIMAERDFVSSEEFNRGAVWIAPQ